MTQNEAIRAHLESGKPLMGMEALRRFGCFRLGARIHDLKAQGLDIESRMVRLPNGKHVAEYALKTGVTA